MKNARLLWVKSRTTIILYYFRTGPSESLKPARLFYGYPLKQIKIDILFSGLAFRIDARQTLCPSDRYGPSVLSLPCAGAARLLWAPHRSRSHGRLRRPKGIGSADAKAATPLKRWRQVHYVVFLVRVLHQADGEAVVAIVAALRSQSATEEVHVVGIGLFRRVG